jgi:ATP adenylyltransferase
MLNKYPYASGHVLVAPRGHASTPEQLDPQQFHALHELLRDAMVAVRDVYRPDGMNVGMNVGKVSGAGIPDHVHYHVVPRWAGDVNFMPVLADTRVISEGLDDAFVRLKGCLG